MTHGRAGLASKGVMNRVSSRAICSAIALSLGFTSQSAFSHSSSSLKIDSCYCYCSYVR